MQFYFVIVVHLVTIWQIFPETISDKWPDTHCSGDSDCGDHRYCRLDGGGGGWCFDQRCEKDLDCEKGAHCCAGRCSSFALWLGSHCVPECQRSSTCYRNEPPDPIQGADAGKPDKNPDNSCKTTEDCGYRRFCSWNRFCSEKLINTEDSNADSYYDSHCRTHEDCGRGRYCTRTGWCQTFVKFQRYCYGCCSLMETID